MAGSFRSESREERRAATSFQKDTIIQDSRVGTFGWNFTESSAVSAGLPHTITSQSPINQSPINQISLPLHVNHKIIEVSVHLHFTRGASSSNFDEAGWLENQLYFGPTEVESEVDDSCPRGTGHHGGRAGFPNSPIAIHSLTFSK